MPPILEASSVFTVNMAHFMPRDLSLFVESLEIISRRKREQQEQRYSQMKANTIVTHAEVHHTPTEFQAEHTVCYEEPLLLPTLDKETTEMDETYFSGPDSALNSQRSSVALSSNPKDIKTGSDSEESGVFPVAETQAGQPTYTPPRPRSEVISKPRSTRTTRARIIGLVLKREYTAVGVTEMEEHNAERNTIEAERCDRVVDEMIKQKFLTLTGKYCKRKKSLRERKKSSGTAEERFISKALRYLTL